MSEPMHFHEQHNDNPEILSVLRFVGIAEVGMMNSNW